MLLHDHGLHHVLLVHGPDADVADGDLHVLEEGEQRLQRAQRARHDRDAAPALVNAGKHLGQIGLNLILKKIREEEEEKGRGEKKVAERVKETRGDQERSDTEKVE